MVVDVGKALMIGKGCVVGRAMVGMEVGVAVRGITCTARVIAAAVYTSCTATSGVAEAVPEQAESRRTTNNKRLGLVDDLMFVKNWMAGNDQPSNVRGIRKRFLLPEIG